MVSARYRVQSKINIINAFKLIKLYELKLEKFCTLVNMYQSLVTHRQNSKSEYYVKLLGQRDAYSDAIVERKELVGAYEQILAELKK